MRPCGVIVLLSELFTAESKTQVYGCLHNYYTCHPRAAADIGMAISYHNRVTFVYVYMLIEFICYDDACHLKRFARNPVRASLTYQTAQLASVEMAVDKMHAKGHTDPWCKANCDPSNFTALMKVHFYICTTSVLITSLQYIPRLILKYASRCFPGSPNMLSLLAR